MTYTTEVTINLSRPEVVALFDNRDNLEKWQEGLKSIEILSGNPGQEGTSSRMIYETRKGELVMTETITRRNFPDEFHTIYKARGVYNEMYNYFEEKEGNNTLWRTVSVFKFKGLMALMAPFMKTAFTNSTILNMERFRNFAETKTHT